AAGEDEAGLFLLDRQRLVLMRAVDHAAFEQAALARAARAIAAAVGQAHARADGGGQDGLVALDVEAAPGGLDGDVETHDGARRRRPRKLGRHFAWAPE